MSRDAQTEALHRLDGLARRASVAARNPGPFRADELEEFALSEMLYHAQWPVIVYGLTRGLPMSRDSLSTWSADDRPAYAAAYTRALVILDEVERIAFPAAAA